MVCDKHEWDNIDMVNAHTKKAMCMSSHSKPTRGAANYASKHASYLTIQSAFLSDVAGVHYSADKRGTREESSRQPQKLLNMIEQLGRSYHCTRWSTTPPYVSSCCHIPSASS